MDEKPDRPIAIAKYLTVAEQAVTSMGRNPIFLDRTNAPATNFYNKGDLRNRQGDVRILKHPLENFVSKSIVTFILCVLLYIVILLLTSS